MNVIVCISIILVRVLQNLCITVHERFNPVSRHLKTLLFRTALITNTQFGDFFFLPTSIQWISKSTFFVMLH